MRGVDYGKVSDFFKTLGNPTRLRIVKELSRGEQCVGAMEDKVQTSQARVSQHLMILKKQGIVACRKEKNMRCYYLKTPEFIHSVLALIEDEEQRRGVE